MGSPGSSLSFVTPVLIDELRLAYAEDDTFRGHLADIAALEDATSPGVTALGDAIHPPDSAVSHSPPSAGTPSPTPLGGPFRRGPLGLLFHAADDRLRLCIPFSCRLAVLHSLHDEMGHPGARRTLAKASECVFWPSMSKDIRLYCRSCHGCQTVKTDTTRKPGALQPIPAISPFHTFCIDFVEGLPACMGYDSLATCTDKYTKAVRLLPCKKSDTAVQFANRYFGSLFSTWGIPAVIISDRDCRFTSGFWDTLLSLGGTKLAMTTAFHPQADGQSERKNRTIEASLRIMLLESDSSWVALLPAIEFAHNSYINVTTSKSPFDLLYGCAPMNFGDRVSRLHLRHSVGAEDMAASLTLRRKEAESAMLRAQEHQKRYYDATHSPLSFLPGDLACLRYHRRGKLDPVAHVVQIVDIVSPVSYRIKVPPGLRMHDVVSIEHLRCYVRREGAPPPPPLPTPCAAAVARVLGERLWNGSCEILCFRGDEVEADATWDDVSALDGDLRLLQEFRARWNAWVPSPRADPLTRHVPARHVDSSPPVVSGPPDPIVAADADSPSGPRRSGRRRRATARALGV